VALSPKTARTLNKKKNKTSCAAVGQHYTECLHAKEDGRSYQRMKSSVFSHCLKVLSVAADVTETGRLFHTWTFSVARN